VSKGVKGVSKVRGARHTDLNMSVSFLSLLISLVEATGYSNGGDRSRCKILRMKATHFFLSIIVIFEWGRPLLIHIISHYWGDRGRTLRLQYVGLQLLRVSFTQHWVDKEGDYVGN
jgi:hypothetical protein